MAGDGRIWVKPLAVAALLMSAGTAALSQSARNDSLMSGQSATIVGRLTNLYSKPLEGATVTVRNEATGAVARATTGKNGIYRIAGLSAGEYTLEAECPQLGRGRLEGIAVLAGQEARMQTALALEPMPSAVEAKIMDHRSGISKSLPQTAMPVLVPAAPAVKAAAAASIAIPPPAASGETPKIAAPAIAPNAETAKAEAAPRGNGSPSAPAQAQGAGGVPVAGIPSRSPVEAESAVSNGRGGTVMVAMAVGAAEAAMLSAAPLPRKAILAASQIDPVAEAVTTTVAGEQLRQLPLSGRHWENFVLDTPTASTAAGGQAQTSLRGAGAELSEITVDGAGKGLAFGGGSGSRSVSNTQGGTGESGMAQVWAGGRGFGVSEAAIREVQTTAGNVESEASRAAGGRMNVETQHGSNGLHGQGFAYDRQNNWGARNPYTQWITETGSTAPFAPYNSTLFPVFDNGYGSIQSGPPERYTPPDHETVWGLGMGSQIRRDKLFWFGAVDSYKRNDPGLATVKHPYLTQTPSTCAPGSSCAPTTTGFFAQPTNDQMQVLSARLGLSSVNPVAEGLSAYSPMLETLAGLLGPAPRKAAQWTGFGRIDWQAAERHRFTLEGTGARWNSPGGGLTRVEENYGTNSFGNSKASEEWLLGRWEAYITPNLLSVTQSSAGREILTAKPSAPSAYEQTLLTGNTYGQLPQIVVDNRYGFTIGNPSRFGQGSYPDEHLYHAQESLDWIRGKLMVRSGFELNHNTDATSLLRNQTGTYTYSNVDNFISDALTFAKYGLNDALDPDNQHNCDETGKVWTDSTGTVHGLGYLPCYSSYSQTMGPTNWWLSTNDFAGYSTVQWQPMKFMVVSAGLRWEREQMPPPLAQTDNPELPLTERIPSPGNNWGPRISMAIGSAETHWPVLRLGYGMYYGRTENATIETALTHTGSTALTPAGLLKSDLNFFMRPTDNLNGGGAPPFPYVPSGPPGSVIKPDVVEFAPNFRNPEVHQAVAAVEETLPGHVEVTGSAMISLGRRLPVTIDSNLATPQPDLLQTITYAVVDATGKGPIQAPRITVPFYTSWPTSGTTAAQPCPYYKPTIPNIPRWLCPDYQQIDQITSKANSTYEAAMLKVVRYGRRGLSLHAHYTYSHTMDWNPNESPLIPDNSSQATDFIQEYGTSNLDSRHSAAATVIYEAPWKLRNLAGKLANGWMVSGIGQFRSGLPYTMRVSGSLAEKYNVSSTGDIELLGMGLGPGMNGSGGDNRVYGVGRNTYRYPATWKADMRLAKRFDLGNMRQLELLAESFNLFNHQNVTELETNGYYIESGTSSGELPTLNFLTGPVTNPTTGTITKANSTAFGQPLSVNGTNFYRERQIQFGLRMRF